MARQFTTAMGHRNRDFPVGFTNLTNVEIPNYKFYLLEHIAVSGVDHDRVVFCRSSTPIRWMVEFTLINWYEIII